MKKISEILIFKIAIPLGVMLFKIMALTYRFRELNGRGISPRQGKKKQYIYGFFHSQILAFVYDYRGTKMGSLASTHRDGEIAARVASGFGIKMARGSSTRGGAAALRGLKSLMKRGYDTALTVDGPRGPAGSVNRGIIYLASLTGKEIVPVGFACAPCARLRTWDRFMIPLPFAGGYFNFGSPMRIPRGIKGKDIEIYSEKIRDRLLELNRGCAAERKGKHGR